MKVLAIAALNLRRVFRKRANIFYIVVTPLLMVFVLGMLFGGGSDLRVGVAQGTPGPLADRLVRELSKNANIEVTRVGSEAELRATVERGSLHAGLVIPADYDAALRAGRLQTMDYVARPDDQQATDVGVWVRSVVAREASLLRAARFGVQESGGSLEDRLAAADKAVVPGVEVRVTTTANALFPEGFVQFDVSAPPLLLLFVFLTSMTAAVGLVETRRWGVLHRMYTTATRARTIVAGEALGRLGIALVQGLIIMLGSALLFGVRWGDPLSAVALLTLFAITGSGAAMLLGTRARTEGSAAALAPLLGVGLGALGGTMIPLDSFGETMRTLAHVTPHAWAYDGFAELLRHRAGILDIAPQLAALAGFAVVLLSAGVWQLRRSLLR